MKAEELKSSELRIGNFLRAKKDYHNQFHGNGIVSSIEQTKFVILDHYPGKWFEPIPLTEEWLLKFGYCKKIGARVGYGYDCGHGIMRVIQYNATLYQYRTWSNIDRLNGFSWNKTRIDYVHQLQNLYFALTGEELTLKP
jgi:hypothetical protein